MLKVDHLFYHYGGKSKFSVEDISFAIQEGEIFGFLGPSGAGKSTIQNLMTGLLKLQEGDVTYGKTSIRRIKKAFYNEIGVSFEQPNLYPNLTGEENLNYYAGLFTVPTRKSAEVLEQVGLLASRNKKAGDYSKGMKQRLVFARALINNPKYLFLDEPTSGLDPNTAVKICDLILEEKKKGTVIFLTTHNMELADRLCDRVAFLAEGKIRAMDAPDRLKLQYGSKKIAVTYLQNQRIQEDFFDLQTQKEALLQILTGLELISIHSDEATLEDIFIRITGRGLTS